jgi:hypothetical protein
VFRGGKLLREELSVFVNTAVLLRMIEVKSLDLHASPFGKASIARIEPPVFLAV